MNLVARPFKRADLPARFPVGSFVLRSDFGTGQHFDALDFDLLDAMFPGATGYKNREPITHAVIFHDGPYVTLLVTGEITATPIYPEKV